MANNENGVWRTVGGRRIFIKKGQDLATAMRESGKFGNRESRVKADIQDDIDAWRKYANSYQKSLNRASNPESKERFKKERDEAIKWHVEPGEKAIHDYDTPKEYKGKLDESMGKHIDKEQMAKNNARYEKKDIKGPESKEVKEINDRVTKDWGSSELEDTKNALASTERYLEKHPDDERMQKRAEILKKDIARLEKTYKKEHDDTSKEKSETHKQLEKEMKEKYMNISEEERVKAYEEGKNWKDLVKERENQEQKNTHKPLNDEIKRLNNELDKMEKGEGTWGNAPDDIKQLVEKDTRAQIQKYENAIKDYDQQSNINSQQKLNNYADYYKKENLGTPSNYKEGTKVEIRSDYNERYNGTIVREATNEEKQNHINTNLKGYIVRDANGNESVVADTKIQERYKVPGTKMYTTDERDQKSALYNAIQNDANRRYDKKEITREERNKIIDDAHDKYIKLKETKGSNQVSDTLRKKAYQKYLKEHPNSKMKFEDFIK